MTLTRSEEDLGIGVGDVFDTKAAEATARIPATDDRRLGVHASTSSAWHRRPIVQADLIVGSADDEYEHEADRVAAAVMRDLDGQSAARGLPDAGGDDVRVRRALDPAGRNGDLDPIQLGTVMSASASASAKRVGRIRRMANPPPIGTDGGEVDGDTGSRIRRASGAGLPLDPTLRRSMESSFGADFSAVRVHADSGADDLNQRIRAKAFTTGRDIFFGKGQYDPASRRGQRLVAHELTHVVQQGAAGRSPNANDPAPRVRRAIQRVPEREQPALEEWFKKHASGLEDHEWFMTHYTTAFKSPLNSLAGAVRVLDALVAAARSAATQDLANLEVWYGKFVSAANGQLSNDQLIVMARAAKKEATVDGAKAELTAAKERGLARASVFAKPVAKRQPMASLQDQGWAIGLADSSVVAVGQGGTRVSTSDNKKFVLYTSGVGGCLGVAACTGTKGFVAHFQPDQINPENSSLQDQVNDITNRLGGKCRYWLASPSLAVDYIQSFKRAMEAAGHTCGGEFVADRIALNLQLAASESPVLHKFDTSGLPSD